MKATGIIIVLLIGSIYGKPFDLADDEPTCGYDSCHPIDVNKINVHLIPHSHDDVGWLNTVDQYYYRQVQYIISSVVESLLENSDRRFIQVETAYFYMWWNLQSDNVKADVRKLINEGRLEIVNGAWSMNDEAAVHYQSTIDQYTVGLRFIEDILGKCARPRVGWQIDPFGHSREQASLLTQFGMDGVFFARIDYRDRTKRRSDKTMDMLWTGSANLGNDTNIFTSVFNYHYSAPAGFCFDITCYDEAIVTDKESPEYNWDRRVQEFIDNVIRDYTVNYPTNNILITLGDDFKWEAADRSYINLDRLIEGFKVFNPTYMGKEINVMYSTPSCYTKAVRDTAEANKQELDVKTDDFFPYADGPNTVWSGYFTSRPTSKRLERFANNLLQVTKQITTLGRKPYGTNDALTHAMGVMQHHDAITGTEKAAVEKDYHRSLVSGMHTAISDISSSFSSILGLSNDLDLKSCLLANVSICAESDKDTFTAVIYNPLARNTSHYIQIPVNDGTWRITGPSGEDVETYLADPIGNFSYITRETDEKVLDKVLFFRAENLPPLGYKVYTFRKIGSKSQAAVPRDVKADYQLGFSDKFVDFDLDTGLLKSITINDVTLSVSQQLMFYVASQSDGAYIFRPHADQRDAVEFGDVESSVLINDGNLVREIKQTWRDWATQIIRIYKEEDFIEFDWLVGPIDISDYSGKEVISRFTTELKTNEEFYTDSNGREIIYRKTDYRPTYEYTAEEPQAGNYYPVNTKILIKDEKVEFAVLTDRSEGGASLFSGEVELILSRALLYDDYRGVGENLNEVEYNQQLVARGSHFVTIGESSRGNGKILLLCISFMSLPYHNRPGYDRQTPQYDVAVDERILKTFEEDPTRSIRNIADMQSLTIWRVWSVVDGRHTFRYTPLSRALLYDDNRGVAENLNEREYSQQLVARGSHFVTLGESSRGNGGRTMAAVERDIAQRKLLQPWVFYTSEDIPVKEQSFLNHELPANVHLLTLESWNEEGDSILIRFEHILEKNEDPKLSQEVTIDVSDLFKSFKIKSMKEYLLAANTPIEESTRLKWSQITELEDESSPLNMKNRLARDESDLTITLAPMQIRTFVAVIDV